MTAQLSDQLDPRPNPNPTPFFIFFFFSLHASFSYQDDQQVCPQTMGTKQKELLYAYYMAVPIAPKKGNDVAIFWRMQISICK